MTVEYDDAAVLAERNQVTLTEVREAAALAWGQSRRAGSGQGPVDHRLSQHSHHHGHDHYHGHDHGSHHGHDHDHGG